MSLTNSADQRRIRQHGPNSELFDMADFLPIVLKYHSVTHWIVDLEWAMALSGDKVEASRIPRGQYSSASLVELYEDIYQTIDGELTAYEGKTPVAYLEAFDSSFWNVRSESKEFLDSMERRFGIFES